MLKKRNNYSNKVVSLDDEDINADMILTELGTYMVPDIIYENHETRKCLIEAIDNMSEDDRFIIYLKYVEDWSYAQIAEFLGLKESTVRVRSMRIKEKLASEIDLKLNGKEVKSDAQGL